VSQANVEIVKRMTDAFNRRDVDAWMECATPDCELLPAMPRAVERAGYRGRTGVEAYVGEITETWEEYRLVPDEFRDLGERVLMLGRIEVCGKGSGTPVDAPFGAISEFRDGKVLRLRGYLDHSGALRAAGLAG
jgi:ketosteroid isomerase-like protein